MELVRKPIHYVREGKRTFDQFYLDEDYNVPDAKEDVQRIIQGTAEVKTEDIRLVENYVRIAGKVFFRILYVTSSVDPKPAVLEGKLPFEEMVYTENGEEDSFFIQNVRTEFSSSVVNSRKLSLKINLLKVAVTRKDTYRIKEEITLPGTKESIGQILLSEVEIRKLDIRAGLDELLLRGELLVFCMYLSGEEKPDWITQTVPYEGRISCDGVTEDMYYYVQPALEDTLVDIRMDEDGEMRILGIEGTLGLRMNIYEEEEMEILEDMYSLEKQCVFQTREAVYEELLMQNQSKCRVTERLELPELKDDVLQILHSRGSIQTEHVQNTSEGIQVEGILHVSFLYMRADDMEPYGSWQGMIPFSYLIECGGMTDNVCSNMAYHVEQLLVTLTGSEAVEIKAVLAFDTFVRKTVPVEVITEAEMQPINMEEMDQRPGIVGHIVQQGEDLWSLAKKYMTTVEGIMEVNGLQDESTKSGDKLLIFKENMSIL